MSTTRRRNGKRATGPRSCSTIPNEPFPLPCLALEQLPQRRQLRLARRLRGEGGEWDRVLKDRLQHLDGVLPQLRVAAFQRVQKGGDGGYAFLQQFLGG